MYRIAQKLVQHKLLTLSVVAVGAFFLVNDDSEASKPSSPWAQGAVVQPGSPVAKQGMTDKLMGYVSTAGDVVAEKVLGDKELNPVRLGEQTTQNFENTAKAMEAANR